MSGFAMDMYQKAQSLWNSPEVDRAIQALNEQGRSGISRIPWQRRRALWINLNRKRPMPWLSNHWPWANMLDLSEQIRELAQLQDQIQWKINPGALSWKRNCDRTD